MFNETVPIDEDLPAVHITVMATCSLSIVGSLFIILAFALFKDFQHSQSRRLLVILSFCDLLTAIAYLITPKDVAKQTKLCDFQAALNIFANQTSFLWTDFIALFVLLSRKYGVKEASRFIPFFHIISWGIPALSVIIIGLKDMWGYDSGYATADWCWIKGADDGEETPFYWHIIGGKGVEWASCIFITIVYIFVFVGLRKGHDQQLLLHRGNTWKITEKKLLAIPIIFIFLRTPGTIRTVYLMVHPQHPLMGPKGIAAILQAIGDSGQGFANGLIFGVFTEKVRSYYYKALGRFTKRSESGSTGKVNEGLGIYSRASASQTYY
jgi:G protein-coupled receptor 157